MKNAAGKNQNDPQTHLLDNMKHLLLCAAAILVFLGAGCAKQPPAPQPTPSPTSQTPPMSNTRALVEQEYERVRILANQDTPDAFFAAIDASVLTEQTKQEMRAGWAMAPRLFKDMMPAFTNGAVKFVDLIENDEWAGYYYAYRTDDDITSLAVRRFHKVDGAWKVANFSMTSLEGNAYDTLDRAAIQAAIQESSVMGVLPPKVD